MMNGRLPPPSGVKRIAVLGDSFTEAKQVNDADDYETRLERKFRDSGKNVEALNFGIEGMGTTQEYLTLKTYAMAYKPDLVIIQIYPFNDVYNNSPVLNPEAAAPYILISKDGKEEFVPAQDPTKKLPLAFLSSHLYSYRWAVNMYYRIKHSLKLLSKGKSSSKNQVISTEKTPLVLQVYDENESRNEQWQEAWRVTEEMLRRVKNISEENHFKLLAFLVPASFEVFPEHRESSLPGLLSQHDEINKKWNIDLTFPRRRVAGILNKYSIPFIDLSDVFMLKGKEEPPYYIPHDEHFTLRGHEVAAEAIFKAITEQHLLY